MCKMLTRGAAVVEARVRNLRFLLALLAPSRPQGLSQIQEAQYAMSASILGSKMHSSCVGSISWEQLLGTLCQGGRILRPW